MLISGCKSYTSSLQIHTDGFTRSKVVFYYSGLPCPISQFLNGKIHGSEPLSSPASGWQKRGNLESLGAKNVRARLEPFHFNWPEPVLFGRPERTYGKPPKLRDFTDSLKLNALFRETC